MHDIVVSGTVAVIIVILIVLIFNRQIFYWLDATKNTVGSVFFGPASGARPYRLPEAGWEKLQNPKDTSKVAISNEEVDSTLDALGYTRDAPWDAIIAETEIEPSAFANHMDFVKDVRRFSSGSNFTSVTDDNTNAAFTNFVGLRRPWHVPIGPDARQQPDIDESVLQRNKPMRW
jgi:hypothetical protein